MAYSFFLGEMQLPVAPGKLQTKIKNQNKTVNLINESEVNILKSAGLTEILMEVLLPQTQYPFAVYPQGFRGADYYLQEFEKLKVSREPFQFICSRTLPNGTLLFDTNIKVSLEDYDITEDADEGVDIKVTLNLKQYRSYGVRQVNVIKTSAGQKTSTTNTRPAEKTPAKSYTTKAGDCLWNIAKKFLGDGSRYGEIYLLNKGQLSNPNVLPVGITLTMP